MNAIVSKNINKISILNLSDMSRDLNKRKQRCRILFGLTLLIVYTDMLSVTFVIINVIKSQITKSCLVI